MVIPLLSQQESDFLSDSEIFQTRRRVSEKIIELFGECARQMESALEHYGKFLPSAVYSSRPKISKGENYLGYPWTVLDYPRYFKGEDVFALRTLCWWGNYFSITLHLGGSFASALLPAALNRIDHLPGTQTAISVSKDPWQHHSGEDNFRIPDDENEARKLIEHCQRSYGYFKLMKRFELSEWEKMPVHCIETASLFFRVIG